MATKPSMFRESPQPNGTHQDTSGENKDGKLSEEELKRAFIDAMNGAPKEPTDIPSDPNIGEPIAPTDKVISNDEPAVIPDLSAKDKQKEILEKIEYLKKRILFTEGAIKTEEQKNKKHLVKAVEGRLAQYNLELQGQIVELQDLVTADKLDAENKQISQINAEIESEEGLGNDSSLLTKQKDILEQIKNIKKDILYAEEAKRMGEQKNNEKLIKTAEARLAKYNQELQYQKVKLQDLVTATKLDAENQQISQIDAEIESEEGLGNDSSLLTKQKDILEQIKNIKKDILYAEEARKKGEKTNNKNLTSIAEGQLAKYNQELSNLRLKLKGESKVESTENVKRIVVSRLKELEIDPSLFTLFTEDAVLLEDLLKGTNLKDALTKLVSDKLREATDQLAVAGIKLDNYGEPKVGILSRVFTNKAINQKNSPEYKKYRMLMDLNKKISESVQNKQVVSEYTGPIDHATFLDKGYTDEAVGYRVTKKPEVINKVLEEVRTTTPSKGIEIDSKYENIADKAGTVGAIAATAAILGAVAPGLEMEKPKDTTTNESLIAVAPKVKAEPTSPYLEEQSKRVAELEEGTGRQGVADVARRGPESVKVREIPMDDLDLKEINLKPVKKLPAKKSQTSEVQEDVDNEPISFSYPHGDKLVSMDEDEPSFHSLVDEIKKTPNTPNPDGYPYATAFKPKSRIIGPETAVKPAEILPPPDNDIEKIIKLFPQELVDASGNKARFKDYVAHILSYAPDASLELTKLSTEFKAVKSMKSRDQIKNLFLSIWEIAKKHGVPNWKEAKFVMDYITQK